MTSRRIFANYNSGDTQAPPPQGPIGKLLDAHYDGASFPAAPPQEQLLLHELNHRVGNEFCCAISVVSLAAARSSNKEVKAVLTEVAELLHHYAEVHHALQMPEHGIRTDVAAYLRKLFTARIPSVRPDSSASRVPARLRYAATRSRAAPCAPIRARSKASRTRSPGIRRSARVRDARLRTNIGNVSTLDDAVAAFNPLCACPIPNASRLASQAR